MSKLRRDIRSAAKRSNLLPAKIISVSGMKATVRLSGKGAVYSNLQVIGGEVHIGDEVKIDFSTDIPFVVSGYTPPAASVDREESRAGLGASKQATGFETGIILYGVGYLKGVYDPTDSGMTLALAESEEGDTILIPNISLTNNYTILAGRNVVGLGRTSSVFTGQLSLEGQATLENLTVSRTGGDLVCVNTTSGSVVLQSCDLILVSTSGSSSSGSPACLTASGQEIEVIDCTLSSSHYGMRGTGLGSLRVRNTSFECSLADVAAVGGLTAYVGNCQIQDIFGVWDLLSGDRGVYDMDKNPDYHASDILNNTNRWHPPEPPGGDGAMIFSENGHWVYKWVEGLTYHAIAHGDEGTDELIHVGADEPVVKFPGKIWCIP
jgi:hypothetical protein